MSMYGAREAGRKVNRQEARQIGRQEGKASQAGRWVRESKKAGREEGKVGRKIDRPGT